jgi:LPXTG-motif cell wall-anchored protein
MKKLALTIAIVLGMGMSIFAQEAYTNADGVSENGLFGLGVSFFDRDGELTFFAEYYELDEQDVEYGYESQDYVESGFFGLGAGIFSGNRNTIFPALPDFGSTGDQDAPLGSGIAVLMGLGAAYLVGKRRKED